MKSAIELSVVFPAYNEENRLERTVRSAVEYLSRVYPSAFEIIVVDDGSRDGTSGLVYRLAGELPGVSLLRLAENRGKGYAVRSGVLNSSGSRVLFSDADGSTPIEEVERLEQAIADGADIAIGSRVIQGQGVEVKAKWYRRVIGRTFHSLVSMLTVKGFGDTQCGFKLLERSAAHDLFSRMRMGGFSFDVELLMMAVRQAYVVREIPVNWEHQPGSRVRLVIDSLKMARDLFIIRGRALRGDYDRPHLAPLFERTNDKEDKGRPMARSRLTSVAR